MNRIDEKFAQLKKINKKALVTFLTAGDPCLEMSEKLILEAEKNGADIIELGVPFSDPTAESSLIQETYNRAIDNDVDIFRTFDFVADIRSKTDLPLVMWLYFNIVLQYGPDKFFAKCKEVGVDAVIIPDLPYEESDDISEYTARYGIYHIQLISPTSKSRIKAISDSAKGFLYCLAPSANADYSEFFAEVRNNTDLPICVDSRDLSCAVKYNCDGIISGESLAAAVATGNTDDEKLQNMITKMNELKSHF